MCETWRAFPLDTRYEVSTQGRLRRASTGRIRKTPLKQNGYLGVVLTRTGERPVGYDLHVMVALTWLGERPPKFDVAHIDGDRLNNNVSNLQYESRQQNASNKNNKFNPKKGCRLTSDQVRKLRADTLLSNAEWARLLGVKRVSVWKARNKKTWRYI